MKRTFLLVAIAALFVVTGCKPSAKEISPLQRKEAAHLASEAQFALQMNDLPRAEGVLAKAVELCPDTGKYWVDLGSIRLRQGKRDAAKAAYTSALAAYTAETKSDAKSPQGLLQQVYVLALLGRADDARAVLAKAQKAFPEHRAVRGFVEGQQLERMLADPRFKEIAL